LELEVPTGAMLGDTLTEDQAAPGRLRRLALAVPEFLLGPSLSLQEPGQGRSSGAKAS
jgi:hypothetical protein